MADLRADAGIGAALTIKKFGVLQTANPLTIRFDVPFFLIEYQQQIKIIFNIDL